MQVLYTANSLGRLGADFSLMIAMLDEDDVEDEAETGTVAEATGSEQRAEGDVDGESKGQDGQDQQKARDDNSEVEDGKEETEKEKEKEPQPQPQRQQLPEPEWISVIKKHRVQAARLEALAAGQDRVVQRRGASDIAYDDMQVRHCQVRE